MSSQDAAKRAAAKAQRASGGRRAKEAFEKKRQTLLAELADKQHSLAHEMSLNTKLRTLEQCLEVHQAYTQHYMERVVSGDTCTSSPLCSGELAMLGQPHPVSGNSMIQDQVVSCSTAHSAEQSNSQSSMYDDNPSLPYEGMGASQPVKQEVSEAPAAARARSKLAHAPSHFMAGSHRRPDPSMLAARPNMQLPMHPLGGHPNEGSYSGRASAGVPVGHTSMTLSSNASMQLPLSQPLPGCGSPASGRLLTACGSARRTHTAAEPAAPYSGAGAPHLQHTLQQASAPGTQAGDGDELMDELDALWVLEQQQGQQQAQAPAAPAAQHPPAPSSQHATPMQQDDIADLVPTTGWRSGASGAPVSAPIRPATSARARLQQFVGGGRVASGPVPTSAGAAVSQGHGVSAPASGSMRSGELSGPAARLRSMSIREAAGVLGEMVRGAASVMRTSTMPGAGPVVAAQLAEAAGRYLDFTSSLALINPDTYYGLHAVNLDTLQPAAPPATMYSTLASKLALSESVATGVAAALGLYREHMGALAEARAVLSARLGQASDVAARAYAAGPGAPTQRNEAALASLELGAKLESNMQREVDTRAMLRHYMVGKALPRTDLICCAVSAWPFMVDYASLAVAIAATAPPARSPYPSAPAPTSAPCSSGPFSSMQ